MPNSHEKDVVLCLACAPVCPDINSQWSTIINRADNNAKWHMFAGPGHFNDPGATPAQTLPQFEWETGLVPLACVALYILFLPPLMSCCVRVVPAFPHVMLAAGMQTCCRCDPRHCGLLVAT